MSGGGAGSLGAGHGEPSDVPPGTPLGTPLGVSVRVRARSTAGGGPAAGDGAEAPAVDALRRAFEDGIGGYPAAPSVGGELLITARVLPDDGAPSGWPSLQVQQGAGRLEVRCGGSVLDADLVAGTAVMELTPAMCAEPDAVRLLLESVFTATLVAGGRIVAVHSGLVVLDGVGLLLRGQSGAGKSTSTYATMRRGATVVSDDWVYVPRVVDGVPADPGAVPVAGYPWRIMMTEDAASRFDELLDAPRVPHPSDDRVKIPVVPPAPQRRAVGTIDAVVILDPDPHGGVDPISTTEAVERFWASSLPTERDHLPVDWVDRFLDRPCFRLRRGASPAGAAERLHALAASLR